MRNFERARIATTEIYELKIHTRVDQVKLLWGVMALSVRSPTTLARSPERRGEVRRRKRRQRRSEQRRLSDARKLLEEQNAGLGPKQRDRLTMKRAAEQV